MKIVSKALKFLFSLYGFLIFLTVMFLLLPFFIYAFLQKPIKGGNLVVKLAHVWADIFFFMIGIRTLVMYEVPHDKNKEFIFVSNHISYLDIPMMVKVIFGQNFRVLGKAEMAKIPIFGAIYKRGAVIVDRESPEARKESVEKLTKFINKKISVFICPEGTFNMTHEPLKFFYDGAFRIASDTQTPIKPILFLDTYDRLNYKSIFSLTPGRCRAVYLSEVSTDGLTQEDVQALKEKVFKNMEEALVRYQASWIIKKG